MAYHPHLRERLTRHYFPDALLSEHPYLVKGEGLEDVAPGVFYRKSKHSSDLVYESHIAIIMKGHGKFEKWGNTVVGKWEGDWVRVGRHYLPVFESGVRVLHKIEETFEKALSVEETERKSVDILIQSYANEMIEKEPDVWKKSEDEHVQTGDAQIFEGFERIPSTRLTEDVRAGSKVLPVAGVEGLAVGDPILIESAAGAETNAIKGFGSIALMYPLKFSHPHGTLVSKLRHNDPRVRELPAEYFAPVIEAPPPLPPPDDEEDKNYAVVKFEEEAEDSNMVKVEAHMLKSEIEKRPQVAGPDDHLPTTMALPVSSLLAPTCLSHTDAKTPDWRKTMGRLPKEDMEDDEEPPLALPPPPSKAAVEPAQHQHDQPPVEAAVEPAPKAAAAPALKAAAAPKAKALQACSWCGFKYEEGNTCPRCGMKQKQQEVRVLSTFDTEQPLPTETRTRASGKAKPKPPSSDSETALRETAI